jgi:hypothetical protein
MAEIMEDRLVNLGIGGAHTLAEHQSDLPGKARRRLEQRHERLARNEEARAGQR